ncbi:Crp/Fnr family transcriptional regulator [uncultured Robinsoniella sp.]|uniref:Crp/Fnr family transcriptional regulator n=1 Tax=uncultured Robinsoniella sp. TaxID=904190 RepID=UPI00374F4776
MSKELLKIMPPAIKEKLVRKQYSAGSPILLSGHDNFFVFFLIQGEAEAFIHNAKGTSTTVYVYESNSVFGEIEPFYDELKPVSISAITACTIDILHKTDFIEWLRNDFDAVTALIATIAEKLVGNSLLIEELSLMNVRERVLRCVAVHYKRNRLHLLTKRQISLEVSSPIRSVNRAIATCTKDGLFCYENKQIRILDEAGVLKFLT